MDTIVRSRRRLQRRAPWPYGSARPEPARWHAHEHGRASAAAKLILVVDDEPSVRMICSFNLGAAGHRVAEAADGQEALAAVRERRPDLVLLDVMMPRLDGWAVAEQLRAERSTSGVPVVFLTARVDETDRRRAHELGAVGYITKPFDPIGLAERLENILGRVERGEREQLRAELLSGRGA